ncbi:MAG: carbamoyltransferase [Parvicella sp.]|jgi:carbamoyltransferase
MKYILGISAFYHDSAACLLKDGLVVAAAQEERFSRLKNDSSFPKNAVSFCLKFANIAIEDVELVSFYEKPFQKFERIIDTYSNNVPVGFWSFKKAIKSWMSEKLWIPAIIKKELNYKGRVIFTDHHLSHAASAFYSSPFNEATIVIVDAVGEKATTSIGLGCANKITLTEQQSFPNSIGLFYSAFTYYCGFKVNSGEYKLMGLAPYGKPIYVDLIKSKFVTILEDGSIELNRKCFGFETGLQMLSKLGISHLELKVRNPDDEMVQYYKDIAASVQVITEDILIKTVNYAIVKSGNTKVVMAGGVALNCKANQKIWEETNVTELWVQPASGDAGGAIGAAQLAYFDYLNREVFHPEDTLQSHIYLGPCYQEEEIEKQLLEHKIEFKKFNLDLLTQEVAKLLEQKNIVGWFRGRSEFGPRSLGNRSILASPIFEDMKEHINAKIKFREGFRPFAPIVLDEDYHLWFESDFKSKYMGVTSICNRKPEIPSCVHDDNTGRVQVLFEKENSDLHLLISKFKEISKVPVLINTSFNVRGEPIVNCPKDAIRCFFKTNMDVLVIENYLILKSDNKHVKPQTFKPVEYVLD